MNCDKCHQPMPATAEPQRITMDRAYQTRDGRKVTLYCVDAPGAYPIHGRIDDNICPLAWTSEGILNPPLGNLPGDLIEVPPPAPAKWRVEGWANVYQDSDGSFAIYGTHPTKQVAAAAAGYRIACVPITLSGNEGDGL